MEHLGEDYMRVRVKELSREAEALHLARLARPTTARQLTVRLADLRCQLLDKLVGWGFALESCVVQPAAAHNR